MSDRTDDVKQHGLNYVMEFDHVIRVNRDGTVEDFPYPHDYAYAPSLYDGELDNVAWEFFSEGYTGQYGYNGPIMHNSEYIGGRLAEDILSTPGIYAAVIANWSPESDTYEADEDDIVYSEGWAVVRLKAS